MAKLDDVKTYIGVTGDYQNSTIQLYIDEVEEFLLDSGVSADRITIGILGRGVEDLWNHGSGEGKLSPYFLQRAAQLALKKEQAD